MQGLGTIWKKDHARSFPLRKGGVFSVPDPDSFAGTLHISRAQFMEQPRNSDIPAEHNAITGTLSNRAQ